MTTDMAIPSVSVTPDEAYMLRLFPMYIALVGACEHASPEHTESDSLADQLELLEEHHAEVGRWISVLRQIVAEGTLRAEPWLVEVVREHRDYHIAEAKDYPDDGKPDVIAGLSSLAAKFEAAGVTEEVTA
jgi:predicted RNA-binding protein